MATARARGQATQSATSLTQHTQRTPSGRSFVWEAREPKPTDSSWTLKLKLIADTAAETLHANVHSARLVQVYDALDRDEARFELETDQGPVQAVLSRSGEYSFFWKR